MDNPTLRHATLVALLCAVGLHAGLVSYQNTPSHPLNHAVLQAPPIDAGAPLEE